MYCKRPYFFLFLLMHYQNGVNGNGNGKSPPTLYSTFNQSIYQSTSGHTSPYYQSTSDHTSPSTFVTSGYQSTSGHTSPPALIYQSTSGHASPRLPGTLTPVYTAVTIFLCILFHPLPSLSSFAFFRCLPSICYAFL